MAFLDELNRINQQGQFLGGIAQASQAIKEKRQNDTLVDKYEEFREKQKELKTPEQTVEEFNLSLKDSLEKVQDPQVKIMDTIGRTVGNMMRIVKSKSAMSDLYQPYITAFATLGEDGVRIANTLSRELEGKLNRLDEQGNTVTKAVEYEKNLLSLRTDALEYSANYQKLKRTEEYRKVNDLLSEVDEDGLMGELADEFQFNDMGLVNQKARKKKQIWLAMKEKVATRYKELYGEDLDDNLFNTAFEGALKLRGYDIKYRQPNPQNPSSPVPPDSNTPENMRSLYMSRLHQLWGQYNGSGLTDLLRTVRTRPEVRDANGQIDPAKVVLALREEAKLDDSFTDKQIDDYIARFGSGGEADEAMNQIVSYSFKLGDPIFDIKGNLITRNVNVSDELKKKYPELADMKIPKYADIPLAFGKMGTFITGDTTQLAWNPNTLKEWDYTITADNQLLIKEKRRIPEGNKEKNKFSLYDMIGAYNQSGMPLNINYLGMPKQ